MSYSPTNWIDGETPVDAENLNKLESGVHANSEAIEEIVAEFSKPVDTLEVVSSIEEMTDPSKRYVLDGYIYESQTVVVEGEVTSPDLFEPTEATSADFLNKRLSGTSGSVSDHDGSFVTDFIPVPDNFSSIIPFTVRLNKGAILTGQSKVVFFSDSSRIGANILTTTNTKVENGETVSDIRTQGDSSSVLPTDWSKVTHVKMQYQLATSAIGWNDIRDCKVTFDAYNETTEGTTRIEFVNTGEVYSPINRNEAIKKNTSDIAVLQKEVAVLKNSGASAAQSGAVWYAVGDSITSGYLIGGPTKTWVAHVLKYNGYDAAKSRNLGVAGIGFVREDPTNAQVVQDIVNSNDFSTVDLVTVAVGINDWQNNCAIEDVKTAMAACFDKILSDNPYCKIFFITPFNKNRGSKETNWALGYEQNGITLEDFVAGQISACNDYGIEVIDMTHNSVINRENLTSVLYDNTHPNETCHIALGRELARKITFA